MNDTINTILTRRTVRAFREEQVKDTLLEQILLAGRRACTARAAQPWHFTVVQDRKLLSWINGEAIAALLMSGKEALIERARQPGFDVFHRAPTVVFVSGENESAYAVTDCANATQNMALAAKALGLGSCYSTTFHVGFGGGRAMELVRRLRLPDGYAVLYALSLGYANREEEAPELREDTVTYLRGDRATIPPVL